MSVANSNETEVLERVRSFLDATSLPYEVLTHRDSAAASAFLVPLVVGAEPDDGAGAGRQFGLTIMPVRDDFGDSYVRLIIVPFIERPGGGFSDELCRAVLNLNHTTPMFKFGLDDDGDLELLTDLPQAQLTAASFAAALQALADYAAAHYALLRAD
ncbi:MAG TPA: YbjN domain-containing protein [Pyrinomonadaceae bacterium]|jgi:hypothetical protein